MRVLHLIDGTAGPGGRLDAAAIGCALLPQRLGGEHKACVIGPAESGRRALRLGAPVRWTVAPPLRLLPLASRRVGQITLAADPDVVHCWGADALAVSRRCLPSTLPRTAVITGVAGSWTQRVAEWLGAPVVGGITLGEGGVQTPVAGMDLLDAPPAVRVGERSGRASLRARLGLDPDDIAVLLLGDSAADAMRFNFLMSLLRLSNCRVVGVAPSWARHSGRARRMLQRLGRPLRMIVTARASVDIAPACDLGVWEPGCTAGEAGSGAVEAVAGALACGLPVVAPRLGPVAALYPEEAQGCLALNTTLPELARVLLSLASDSAEVQRLSTAVLAHAVREDWTGRFARALQGAWSRLVSEPAPASGRVAAGVMM